jgi:two-component system, sensor histidine kinase and response regulator
MNTVKSTFFQIIKRRELLIFFVLIVAGISLYGWLFDNLALASFSLRYKPISPIIAVTFIALSILLHIKVNFEKSRLTTTIVTILLFLIALFYSIVFLSNFFNFIHGIEIFFVKNIDRYGNVLTSYMSPIASLLIIFICISILSISQNNSYIIKNIGGSFTLLVFLISSVLIIAYLYKAPLLFGSQVIPVSLPAVICFLLFSITLLRIYELKFLTHKLIKDNTVTRQLLKSFLPIIVFTVLLEGFLITNISIKPNSLTLFVALILFIVVAVIIFIVIKVSENLGDKLMKAEQALKESEEKYKSLIETANIGIGLSKGGKSLYSNPALQEILGYDENEIIINPFVDFFHPDDKPLVIERMKKRSMGELINNSFQARVIRKNGDIRFVEVVTSTFKINNEQYNQAIITDITEKKLAEQALKESETKLLQLNTDKDRFISILGHDLKSPFNNLLGLSEILTEDIRKLDIVEIEDIANNINKSARSTYNLLEDILLWARAQQGKIPFNPQNLSFKDICMNILETLIPNAKAKNIVINYSSADHLNVFADNDMLKTVLRNLVTNAIKFTNNGGTIRIRAEQTDSKTKISVSDNGIGIPPENLTKLFDISEVITTKGTAKETGTGLGLLLCKEFVEKHGGKIWVESKYGKGSDFKFTMPIFTDQANAINN